MSRPRTTAALVALLALLVTGCSGGSDDGATPTTSPSAPTSTTPAPAVAPARPARAVCHQMTYAQAIAPTDEAELAPCRQEHTAETFAVGELKTISAGHLLAVDSAAVQSQVATTCPQRLARFAGGTPEDLRLSMIRAVWFTPTVAESDAGANWFRCDAIVLAGEDTLAPVRGRLRDVLAGQDGRDDFGMCGTAQPGAADFERVLCRAPHTWRAIRTVDLLPASASRATPYPGEDRARAAGQDVCDDAAKAVAADALDYQWGYEWPSAEQWARGQTFGRCWAPDPA